MLGLVPGSVAIESGTGSGSLSYHIANAIAPHGHLYTFEYHHQRAQLSSEQFQKHGLEDNVTIQHRDVCQNGFGLVNMADAVFLDIPNPWQAIGHSKVSLNNRKVAKMCCFLPCTEQVNLTCQVLRDSGFKDISVVTITFTRYSSMRMDETQTTTFVSVPDIKQRGHSGFLITSSLPPSVQ